MPSIWLHSHSIQSAGIKNLGSCFDTLLSVVIDNLPIDFILESIKMTKETDACL